MRLIKRPRFLLDLAQELTWLNQKAGPEVRATAGDGAPSPRGLAIPRISRSQAANPNGIQAQSPATVSLPVPEPVKATASRNGICDRILRVNDNRHVGNGRP